MNQLKLALKFVFNTPLIFFIFKIVYLMTGYPQVRPEHVHFWKGKLMILFQTMLPFQTKLPIQVTWSKLSYLPNGNQTKLPFAEPCCLHATAPFSHIWENKQGRVSVSKVLFFHATV